ncbi:ABC-three component system protein [Clostridium sartagoforme]|uniref:ABC-three component system protein n=1 Tax=Clostridium sartagoforme TaxID=84031 RepID=UPI0031D29DD9
MDILNFSSYARAIEKGMLNPDHTEITRLLLGFIVDRADVTNKNGQQYNIDNPQAHQWWYQKEEIPKNIKKAAGRLDIQATASDYFDENILNVLSQPKDADTYDALRDLINKQEMAVETRTNLLQLLSNNELSDFLAQTFILAIQKQNKLSKAPTPSISTVSILEDVKKLQELFSHYPKPLTLIPPEDLEEHEMVYVHELFAAYADAEGLEDFSKEDLVKYKRYRRDFLYQRKEYYAAESIRQSVRDTLMPIEYKEFDVLKQETLSGIRPVHNRYYPNGFERLNSVMAHATVIKVNKSLLTQLPGWIGAEETMGVCHMLVNDGEIKWVDDDE